MKKQFNGVEDSVKYDSKDKSALRTSGYKYTINLLLRFCYALSTF